MLLRIAAAVSAIVVLVIASVIALAQPEFEYLQFDAGASGLPAIDNLVEVGNYELHWSGGSPDHFKVGISSDPDYGGVMDYELNDRAWIGNGEQSEARRRTQLKAELTSGVDTRRKVQVEGTNLEPGEVYLLTVTEDLEWDWTASADAQRVFGEGASAKASAETTVSVKVSPFAAAAPSPYGFTAEPDWNPASVSGTSSLDDPLFFDSNSTTEPREKEHLFVPNDDQFLWELVGGAEVKTHVRAVGTELELSWAESIGKTALAIKVEVTLELQ